MRTPVVAFLMFSMVFGCAAGRPRTSRQVGPTPKNTLIKLKRAVARRDRAAEWGLLSPGFKQRMSRRLGRNVDLADYSNARDSQRRNSDVRQAEKAIRGAKIQRVRRAGKGRVRMTVWMGGPLIFGQSVTVSLVFLTRWEVWVQGEAQPYWGFVGDRTFRYQVEEDGSYTLSAYSPRGKVISQTRLPKHRIRAVRNVNDWYFDHLGELERYIK